MWTRAATTRQAIVWTVQSVQQGNTGTDAVEARQEAARHVQAVQQASIGRRAGGVRQGAVRLVKPAQQASIWTRAATTRQATVWTVQSVQQGNTGTGATEARQEAAPHVPLEPTRRTPRRHAVHAEVVLWVSIETDVAPTWKEAACRVTRVTTRQALARRHAQRAGGARKHSI